MMTGQEPILEARGISKSFPGVRALDRVDLALRAGSLTAVLGENGAGKSTLMNIIAGLFPPDEGTLMLDGQKVRFQRPRDAQDHGIATIFQELNLVPNLTIADNIFLGREPGTRGGWLDERRMQREAAALLARLDLTLSARTPVSQLRVGQQQAVEIAKAIGWQARVLIMDEPTSALSEHEIEALFRVIHGLKRDGVAIVYITHKLDELESIADDVVILRDGRLVGGGPFHGLRREDIVRWMIGRDLDALYRKEPAKPGPEALRVEGLTLDHPKRTGDYLVDHVSFHVCRGEVLGIFGLLGAGRTELLEVLFGLHPRGSSGRVILGGRPVGIRSPLEATALGLVLAPEDRKQEGLVLEMSVAANTSLASLDRVERWGGWISDGAERTHVNRSIARFRVKTGSLGQPVRNLSGGNQQKVILAKWLAADPVVLLLDEPTRGIDINAKREIYGLIDELARGGLAVVVVSSELPEIRAIADRILVMCEGCKTAEFKPDEVTDDEILTAALPSSG